MGVLELDAIFWKAFWIYVIFFHLATRHFVAQTAEKPLSMHFVVLSRKQFMCNLCNFCLPELISLGPANPVTSILWTNLFRSTKFRTNFLPFFKFGKITKLLVLIRSGVWCFTVCCTFLQFVTCYGNTIFKGANWQENVCSYSSANFLASRGYLTKVVFVVCENCDFKLWKLLNDHIVVQ